MTEGKLSEQLAQLGAIDEDGRHAHLCHKARELEAEVERLREAMAASNMRAGRRGLIPISLAQQALEKVVADCDAHRAAVAEVRNLLARGPKYWAHVDEFYAIFDKLPEGKP